MRDERTELEKIQEENRVRLQLIPRGWVHHGDMNFSYCGVKYDLSATDIQYAINNYEVKF